jgi:hypothetical protein
MQGREAGDGVGDAVRAMAGRKEATCSSSNRDIRSSSTSREAGVEDGAAVKESEAASLAAAHAARDSSS